MKLNEYAFEGSFGLERETLRVTGDGRLAATPHIFGDDNLKRDFCENQLEIVTPVCGSEEEVLASLAELSEYAEERLKQDGEYLWLNSNPPHIDSEDEIPIARYSGKQRSKGMYREKLQRRYGKRLMTYSGIHFNFSFSQSFIDSLREGRKELEVRNELYLRLFRQASRYSWLPMLLTAASPVYDCSLEGDGLSGTGFDGYSSRRSGDKGYWNAFVPQLDYSSLDAYAESVERYINKGALFSAGELYLPVRLKPRGENSIRALSAGVDHIELRMFDLNPLAPQGIFSEDIKFAHYFLVYLLSLPDFEFTHEMQAAAIANHKAAAMFDLDTAIINGYPAADAAKGLLEDIRIFYSGFHEITEIVDYQIRKLSGKNRYSDKIKRLFGESFQQSFLKFTLERSENTSCASCLAQA